MIFETKACVGCESCELACSFHHVGKFQPAVASIKVQEQFKDLAFTLELFDKKKAGHLTCDQCKTLPEPMCVKHCSPLMKSELSQTLRKFWGK